MPVLRPIAEFAREIKDLAATGVRKVSLPDTGLYVGGNMREGIARMKALLGVARAAGVTLYLRNERGGDLRARAHEHPMGVTP